MGEAEPAAAQFSEWVNAHKDFAHCIYLALFYYREGWTNQAVQAVHLALDQPFEESLLADVNKFYVGENAALIAFAAGDYDLCLALCDKMLSDADKDKWWRRTVLRIKAAATFMKGNQTAAIDLMKQAGDANKPDPFGHERRAKADQALLGAIQKKNTESVKDFGNWVDEMDWYSPFETDETAMHGSGLNIPTPYPASWKSDRMNPNIAP